MNEKQDYYQYEEKITARQLKQLDSVQTFKLGLEISEFSIKTFFDSVLNQYRGLSRKAAAEKFRSLMRNI